MSTVTSTHLPNSPFHTRNRAVEGLEAPEWLHQLAAERGELGHVAAIGQQGTWLAWVSCQPPTSTSLPSIRATATSMAHMGLSAGCTVSPHRFTMTCFWNTACSPCTGR